MFNIAGLLLAGGGITWQILGAARDGEPEGLSLNFPFHGRPPTARRARQVVFKELSAAENWLVVKGRTWLLDLGKLRERFKLPLEWLDGVVIVEPEYDILPDTFRKEEMRGMLRLVVERAGLEPAPEAPWDEYPDQDAAELVPLLRRRAFDRDAERLLDSRTTRCRRGSPGSGLKNRRAGHRDGDDHQHQHPRTTPLALESLQDDDHLAVGGVVIHRLVGLAQRLEAEGRSHLQGCIWPVVRAAKTESQAMEQAKREQEALLVRQREWASVFTRLPMCVTDTLPGASAEQREKALGVLRQLYAERPPGMQPHEFRAAAELRLKLLCDA